MGHRLLRVLWATAAVGSLGLLHCSATDAGSTAGGTTTPDTGAEPLPEAGTEPSADAAIERVEDAPLLDSGSRTDGLCALGPIDGLPACPDGVRERSVCDGSLLACRSTPDAAEPTVFVCQNLADGIPLEWTAAVLVATPCQDRQTVSCAVGGATEQQRANRQVSEILRVCLGNESWLSVAFTNGCATLFTISSRRPDELACVTARLESERYLCALNVRCAGAVLSTLP